MINNRKIEIDVNICFFKKFKNSIYEMSMGTKWWKIYEIFFWKNLNTAKKLAVYKYK